MDDTILIHLTGDADDHSRLLAAVKIADVLDWSNLALVEPGGKVQDLIPGEQARLLEEAQREAGRDETMSSTLPLSGPISVLRPLIYVCPLDKTHPTRIGFEGDRPPHCIQHSPSIECVLSELST